MEHKRSIRRRMIARHCDLPTASVLEIGALDEPTLPDIPNVRYMDWFSAEHLRETLAGNRHRKADKIVEVNYVVGQKRFGHQIDERFNMILANHVIEHIADPIAWLRELAAITTPDARLIMAVPDRRYTFDYIRPVSTAVDILRANEDDLQRPDVWQILSSIYHQRPLRAEDFWGDGVPREKLEERRFGFAEALAIARRHAAAGYADVHCFVYTAQSFRSVYRSLGEADLIPWQIEEVRDVEQGHQEFLVCMSKH